MIITGLTITALSGLAIAAIGLMYLLAPRAAATSFGLTDIPESSSTPWLRIKGVRDATCGVVAGVLLLTAPSRQSDGLCSRSHSSRSETQQRYWPQEEVGWQRGASTRRPLCS